MKNKELLTVIVPYFNNSYQELKKALESIIKQKKIDFKILILIVDDHSKKKIDLKALNLIKYNRKKIRINIFRKKRNQGDSSARATGVKISKSKYIAFLDADDYWRSFKLYFQFKFLREHGKKIVGSDWNNKTHFANFLSNNSNYYRINKIKMALQWWPHISTIVMERYFFKKLNLNHSGSYRFGGDGDILIKLASSNLFFILNKDLVRCHSFKMNPYVSGMTSKLKEMHSGEIKVINDNFTNLFLKFFLIMWIKFKFIIRVTSNLR
jgi:glycosyltransferase involved in cell wall biosynthesis